MADKQIIIDGKTVMYGTSIKASPETNVSSTSTFDGAITQGTDKIAWSIELSKVRFDDSTSYKELHKTLDEMFFKQKVVTVRETVHTATESFTIVDNYFGCILDGNEYEIKPDDHTAESIKFKASSRERKYE
jgi:hypothetical protein